MRCFPCQGTGKDPFLGDPCPDCNGSGVAHCCDGIQEQRDPGDEAPDWPDRLGEMERDVTGCAGATYIDRDFDEAPGGPVLPLIAPVPCEHLGGGLFRIPGAGDPVWDAHWRDTLEKAREFNAIPDTHAEWRSLNGSDDV